MTTDRRTATGDNGLAGPICACLATAIFLIINAVTIASKSMWVDEMRTGYAAFAHSPRELFRYLALNDPVSPLYSLISAAVCKLFGISEFTLRLPALLFGSASIIAFAPVAAKFLKRESAVIAVFLLALSPNLIGYSQEARAYTAFLFVSLLAFRLIAEFNETRSAPLKLAAIFVIGMFTHAFFAFVILNCVLYAFMFNGDKTARAKTLTCVVVAVVAFAPWILSVSGMSHGAPERLPGPELSALMKAAFVFGGLIVGNAYIEIGLVSMACITGIALWLYGIVRMWSDSKRAAQVVLLWTFAPIVAVIGAFAVFTKLYDMFHFRYVIFALPAVVIPIAAGAGYLVSEGIIGVFAGEGSFAERFKRAWLKPEGAINLAAALFAVFFLASIFSNIRAYYKAQNQDWRGAAEYINDNAEPGDTVVLHSIADSSVRFYARMHGNKYNFTGTNRISVMADVFSAAPRKYFVYYRPRYGKNILEKTQKEMDSLVREKAVFPGLYGDVVVGRSEEYTLVNEFSLLIFDKLPARKPEFGEAHPVVMKEIEKEFNRRRYTFFNIRKGGFMVVAREREGAISYGLGDAAALNVTNDGREYSVKWDAPIFITLERGLVDVDVLSPDAGFTLQRRKPIKFVDEGTGPEFRGYFLDWIKK